MTWDIIPAGVAINKLPNDADEAICLVRIGDYDICPYISSHVASTKEIDQFRITRAL